MDILAAEKERTLRFYHWAVDEVQREMDSGWPRVSSMQSSLGKGYIYYADSLDAEDRRRFVLGMLSRSHPVASKLAGQAETPKQQNLMGVYADAAMPICLADLTERFKRFNERPRMDRRRLTTMLVERLSAVTGARLKRDPESGGLGGQTWFGDWEVETWLLVVSRTGASYVEVRHLLARKDMPGATPLEEYGCKWQAYTRMITHGWTDYLRCLGVAPLTWDVPCADDEAPCVESLTHICDYYLSEIRGMLVGVDIAD